MFFKILNLLKRLDSTYPELLCEEDKELIIEFAEVLAQLRSLGYLKV